ncbi:kinase-like domain-containing protein [Amanita rubescens]|nr:kinase-like domain-containing protein [Amanita rubescens]
MDSGVVGSGGFGSVFKGEYGGRLVALKLLNKVCHQSSLRKDFLREAVAWRSLSHRFILPLFGIYEEKSWTFLVSPFMMNGTLSGWRKKQTLTVVEILRLMTEVAEGIQYLHSDGIIHGDLHGRNVLLDSDFHCQITDFGLTRHSDATVAWSTKTFVPNFAAPELFGICAKCHQSSCSGCYEGHNRQHREKTMKTDVYSFGCLYYEIYFDTLPYEGKGAYEIVLLVARGELPIRLESPRMDDHTWDLIRSCWESIPPKRPTMELVLKTMIDTTPLLPTLLPTLRVELPAHNAVNPITLDLMRKLLKPDNYHTIADELTVNSDIELFFDFIVFLLHDGSLANDDLPDATRRARRLMGKLSEKDILPKSLFITDVTFIGMRGVGNVSTASHGGQLVTLKVIYRTSHQENSRLIRVICREALAWRTLSHKFILPLLGIYKEKAWLFLVSPLMANGTLSEWRRNQESDITEIHRMIREVAEGVQYIHSEGIVHGDLHGRNIFLDMNFHCQIAGFGLTRHCEATDALATMTHLAYFAAPELFGTCANCGRAECAGRCERPHRSKTMKTDIYAFGYLYYAIFFDTVPFQGKTDYQITRLVTAGMRPDRLENPEMEGDTWNLIQSCWKSLPLERPTMEQIVQMLPQPE